MARTVDLTAALLEIEGEPIEVNLLGRVWVFAPELPAAAVLRIKAAAADPEYEASDEDDLEFLRSMMTPPTQVDELLQAGITTSGLALLIRVVMGVYAGSTPEQVLLAIKAERDTENGEPSANPKDSQTL